MSARPLVILGLIVLSAASGCVHRAAPATQPVESPYEFFRSDHPHLRTQGAPLAPASVLPMRDAAVLEAALWDRLRDAERDTTIFISLGTVDDWQDPPPDFLRRLDDLPYRLKPVSKARLPKRGEMESPDRFRGVEDPATGKRSWIYWAEISNWVSDTKVRVYVGVWSGPLAGGGSTCVFELRDGKWVLTDTSGHWVS